MTSSTSPQVPFLRTSRQFPEDITELSVALTKAYIDIATAVNLRTIAIFPVNRGVTTGENYYIRQNQRQQSLRQVFTFTNTNPIPHGLTLDQVDYFTSNFGQYTDGTNWYGLISATSVVIPGQITFWIDPTNINFVVGAGAPALTKGILVLTWLSMA